MAGVQNNYPAAPVPETAMSAETSAQRVGLGDLTRDDLPSLEILILDAIAGWLFSPANPGKGYHGEHGGAMATLVLNAAQSAAAYHPDQQPVETPAMTATRDQVLAGVQQIAGSPDAMSMFVITLMPAVISQLERSAGDAATQLYWLYCYALVVLAGGGNGDLDPSLMAGIDASFDGWNELMAAGFTVPWRAGASGTEEASAPEPGDSPSTP